MTTTPRDFSSCAHVCTANIAPAVHRNETWLKAASQSWASSEKLLTHLDSIPTGDLFRAMWDGHVALARDAVLSEGYAIRGGALLHIGAADAVKDATANRNARGVSV